MTRTVGVLLFPDFELLDVFGPLEMFGMLDEAFAIRLVAESALEIASKQGPRSRIDDHFADGKHYDVLLVPGGMGTRREVDNDALRQWLIGAAERAEIVASVCTGSALLARAGLLGRGREVLHLIRRLRRHRHGARLDRPRQWRRTRTKRRRLGGVRLERGQHRRSLRALTSRPSLRRRGNQNESPAPRSLSPSSPHAPFFAFAFARLSRR